MTANGTLPSPNSHVRLLTDKTCRVAGGGGLLKQRKKKEAAESKIDFSKFAKQAETPAQKAQQEKALAGWSLPYGPHAQPCGFS
eukprot:COSAG04_NODE_508_length_13301_cov_9.662198_4_plen_84_part_00